MGTLVFAVLASARLSQQNPAIDARISSPEGLKEHAVHSQRVNRFQRDKLLGLSRSRHGAEVMLASRLSRSFGTSSDS